MATSILRRTCKPLANRLAWKPLAFPSEGFAVIPADERIEEETLPNYATSQYYPVTIGEIFRARYQVVGKLGFGTTSTVWLARDLSERRHVALKLYIGSGSMVRSLDNEINAYKRIENSSIKHPGRSAVRALLDSFHVDGPHGSHQCLVHPPLWDSVFGFRHRNPMRRFPGQIMAIVLERLFQALDLLHQECHIAHTDIQESNMLLGADESVLREFEQEELNNPCPRKELEGKTVYQSRELKQAKNFDALVLCDFGSAMHLDDGIARREDIQPDVYRAPEVVLGIPWTSSVDIWNVGCMIWDCFQGGHLFTGHDPELKTYRGRAHLAEMIALLGPPPPSILARASFRSKFFSDSGISIPESRPLEQRESVLEGEDRDCFLRFMKKMLQWEPEKRSSAKELLEDEWILKHLDEGN
ncbi:hypothetical protein E4U25_008116 [Claviceps purpurea]|nr:hypothetical protein E4U25_008116 [Claviceps purpurea]